MGCIWWGRQGTFTAPSRVRSSFLRSVVFINSYVEVAFPVSNGRSSPAFDPAFELKAMNHWMNSKINCWFR